MSIKYTKIVLVLLWVFFASQNIFAATSSSVKDLWNGIYLEQNEDFSYLKYKNSRLKEYRNDFQEGLWFALESSIIARICSNLQSTFLDSTVFNYEEKWKALSPETRRNCWKKLINRTLFTRSLNPRYAIVYNIAGSARWLEIVDKNNKTLFEPGSVDDIISVKQYNGYSLFVTRNISDEYDLDDIFAINPNGQQYALTNYLVLTQKGVTYLRVSSLKLLEWNRVEISYVMKKSVNSEEIIKSEIIPLKIQ